MKKPNFFLIGGPKCGTTSLQEYLAQNPKIFMCTPKEPCYFDSDLPWPDSPKTEREYMRLFENANDSHMAVGEASTNYLYSAVAVEKILRFNPCAKFIVMVRNPIDMAISLHSYSVQELTEDVESFEAAWKLQEERRNGRSLPRLNYHPDFVIYGSFCKLGEQLHRLYQKVERERVHVIVFDDLCASPEIVYRRCLEFIDVPYDRRDAFPARNVTGKPRSQRMHNLLATLLALRQRLPIPRLGLDVFRRLKNLNLSPDLKREISDGFRQELVHYFWDDVQLLSCLVQRDLQVWLNAKIDR